MKRFNITGVCVPEKHYMVDLTKKMNQILPLIEQDQYFTISRARQYGKTTTLFEIKQKIKNKYLVLDLSFEGLSEKDFLVESRFFEKFIEKVALNLERNAVLKNIILEWEKSKGSIESVDDLSKKITKLLESINKDIVLIIDEVDKSSNNQLFLDFLGMLRTKYLNREVGNDKTFKSVILAGVYDVKNLKLKLRPDEEKKYNSPWNIATDFKVDMSFDPEEIVTMLIDYEKDHNTGMNIDEISCEIYKYTSGYPFLVSKICKTIDEELNKQWTEVGVQEAIKIILSERNTLFDDLIKNIENNKDLYEIVRDVALTDKHIPFSLTDPVIEKGNVLGLFKEETGRLVFHNILFSQLIYNHMVVARIRESDDGSMYVHQKYVKSGKLDMELVINKFQDFMKSEYREKDAKFIEREGRLLFLCFLKPIINGVGNYYVEPQTRMDNRMDIVVSYGNEQFIVELKIWHGENYEQEALEQLGGYLDSMGETKGYLVSFNFNKSKEYTAEWKQYEEKEIYAVVV